MKSSSRGFIPLQMIGCLKIDFGNVPRKVTKKKRFLSVTGFTLIELMITIAILLIVIVGLLTSYLNCISLSLIAKNTSIALNGAKAKIEEIRNYSFDNVVVDYSPGCTVGNSFHINNWLSTANHCGAVEIADPSTGTILNTSCLVNPGLGLYEVRVTVSWREKTNRLIGEDANLDGSLVASEDSIVNGQLDSPVKIVTLICRRP